MDDTVNNIPEALPAIEQETKASGFTMASDHQTGSFLRTLVASRPGGRFLELGTGTGLSACWMLDGMDDASRLVTVDSDKAVQAIAQKHLGEDTRLEFHLEDGGDFLRKQEGGHYDLVFADAWPGKFWDRDLVFDLLPAGGLYVVDDMLPQENWPEEHPPKVTTLLGELEQTPGFFMTRMAWSTGIILMTKAG